MDFDFNFIGGKMFAAPHSCKELPLPSVIDMPYNGM